MCKHEQFINTLGEPQSNREYWIMTEIYCYLHGGKDYCDCEVMREGHMIIGLIKDQVGSGTLKLVKYELKKIEMRLTQITAHNSDYAKCIKDLEPFIDWVNVDIDHVTSVLKKHFA